MRMKTLLTVCVLAVLFEACAATPTGNLGATGQPTSAVSATTDRFVPAAGAQAGPGGCGSSQVFSGEVPQTIQAAAGYNAPKDLRYAISDDGNAAGFLFSDPLKATAKPKIFWVMHLARAGQPLTITAHPADASTPVVTVTEPADSGPGEVYPSIVDVPSPGCWVLSLQWAGHTSSVSLQYGSP